MDSPMSESLGQDSQDNQDATSTSPLDSAIEKVKSYIQKPELVTPETLQMLLSDLMDMKGEEDSEPQDSGESDGNAPSGGLTILLGGKGEGQ